MGKFSEMIRELKLNRWQLKELIIDAQNAYDEMIPFYIKEHYKRCGKPNCWCATSQGHGPYVYVVWSEKGRQRQKSLGARATPDQIEAIIGKRKPDWMDFIMTGKALKKALADTEKTKQLHERYLNPIDFERFYGLSKDEDGLNRPDHVQYNFHEYEKAKNDYDEEQQLVHSLWARWGVVNKRGQSVLNSLLDRGFYLSL